MSNVWVTSDLHLNHGNIIKYCNRPFVDTQIMNEKIKERWNELVDSEDIVIVLGDLGFFRNPQEVKDYIEQLNGIKFLILGNHDRRSWNWEELGFYKSIKGNCVIGNYIFSHKPLELNALPNVELINIHGHIHNKPSPYPEFQINVCVEQTDYYPVLLWEIKPDMVKEAIV